MRRFAFLAGRRLRRLRARLAAARQRAALARRAAAYDGVEGGSTGARTQAGTLIVLAHQDDDLLFLGATLADELATGRPVTTIYLTAGDDDDAEWYWRAREAGVRAAYAHLLGVDDVWAESIRTIAGQPVAEARLVEAPRVALLFVRLPDGGIEGSGGATSGGTSLRRLWQGDIATITTVDGAATHTMASLLALLGALAVDVNADLIMTLDHTGEFGDGDHSDHHVVAYLAGRIHDEHPVPHEFVGFRGYPIEALPPNLDPARAAAKQAAFFVYAKSDYKTSHSLEASRSRPEGAWLVREYRVEPRARG